MFGFKTNTGIEPPDPTWANQPSLSGHTQTRYITDPVAMTRAAIASGGFDLRPGQYVRAFYDPRTDTENLPGNGDPGEAQLVPHEGAHAAGWRHTADGTGTNWAGSLKPAGMSPDAWFALLQAHGWQPGQHTAPATGGQGEIGQRQPPWLGDGLSPMTASGFGGGSSPDATARAIGAAKALAAQAPAPRTEASSRPALDMDALTAHVHALIDRALLSPSAAKSASLQAQPAASAPDPEPPDAP